MLEKTRKSIKEKENIERSSIFLAFSHFPSTAKSRYLHWNPFHKKKLDQVVEKANRNHVTPATNNFASDNDTVERKFGGLGGLGDSLENGNEQMMMKLDLSKRRLNKPLK